MPELVIINILKQVFNSKFAEVAMMMHANAAKDEMIELGNDFKTLKNQTSIKTPNLDLLASKGMVFNRFYTASPVCSPTRASCLTGRNPYRIEPLCNRLPFVGC